MDGGVLVAAGLPVPISGTDGFHDFHVHGDHFYLTGLDLPGQVLAFDPDDGFTFFARIPTDEDRVWAGDPPDLDTLRGWTGLERVFPREALLAWIEARRQNPIAVLGNRDILASPAWYGVPELPELWLDEDPLRTARLAEEVAAARRVKDPAELKVMREAAAVCRAGHLRGMKVATMGMTERELAVEIETEFLRRGARRPAYPSIVAAGRNGAVLHSSPSDMPIRDGQLVTVDAGAEVGGYMSDVTRSFPVSGVFTPQQKEIYNLLLSVQQQAVNSVRPGVEFRDLHLRVCVELARGLVDMGILAGLPEDLVERDAHALFFPHGLGHMIGIATHDVGGYLADRRRSDRFGLKWLRLDQPLAPGHVVTIEPGLYFIEALLMDPARRKTFADAVDFDAAARLLDIGGIRIEDDVLCTENEPEVLTAGIPKSVEGLEAACR
jgi:Xaa-Pro aminopeptidase